MCGRALGYRFGVNAAFHGYNVNRQSIDSGYVDGLSLTHGAPGSRQHIWTFASGWFSGSRDSPNRVEQCLCDTANRYHSPSFVGNDYFCESIHAQYSTQRIFYPNGFTGSRSSSYPAIRCPCDNGNTYPSPPFVGNDCFCESVATTYSSHAANGIALYPNAPLWDGQVCEGGGTCCKFNNPPWFTKNLTNSTTEDIELRLCLNNDVSTADIALEQLYVQ